MTPHNRINLAFAVCLIGATVATLALAQDEQVSRIRTALASPERSTTNRDWDAARKPVETVQFVGIKTGMTVVDVFAVGGWFTEVLSAAVGPTGKVYAQNPDFFLRREGFIDSEKELHERLGNVEAVHGDLPDGIAGQADAAITALNLHDMYNSQGGEAAAIGMLKGIYDALKPGGVLGVDRPRRHCGPEQCRISSHAAAAGPRRNHQGGLHDRSRIEHPRESDRRSHEGRP